MPVSPSMSLPGPARESEPITRMLSGSPSLRRCFLTRWSSSRRRLSMFLSRLSVRRSHDHQAGDQRDDELGDDDDAAARGGDARGSEPLGGHAPESSAVTGSSDGRTAALNCADAPLRWWCPIPARDVSVPWARMVVMSPTVDQLDHESCYAAVKSRDRRFDGVFYTAVRTTRIYCRPLPGPHAGLPERHVLPHRRGGPGRRLPRLQAMPSRRDPWDPRLGCRRRRCRTGDAPDRRRRGRPRGRGGPGRAAWLHVPPPHPAADRRARRRTARAGPGQAGPDRADAGRGHRSLFADVAFAAGFSSVRQFNDTIREVYAVSPSELRGRRGGAPTRGR